MRKSHEECNRCRISSILNTAVYNFLTTSPGVRNVTSESVHMSKKRRKWSLPMQNAVQLNDSSQIALSCSFKGRQTKNWIWTWSLLRTILSLLRSILSSFISILSLLRSSLSLFISILSLLWSILSLLWSILSLLRSFLSL